MDPLRAISLGVVLCVSGYNSSDNSKAELLDEVSDLRESLRERVITMDESDFLAFYDDGILLSIYDEEEALAYSWCTESRKCMGEK